MDKPRQQDDHDLWWSEIPTAQRTVRRNMFSLSDARQLMKSGELELVREALEQHSFPLFEPQSHWSALHQAIDCAAPLDVVRLLLEFGADPNLVTLTSLVPVRRCPSLESVLSIPANPRLPDELGPMDRWPPGLAQEELPPPLFVTITKRSLPLVELLLDHRADINTVQCDLARPQTPLGLALELLPPPSNPQRDADLNFYTPGMAKLRAMERQAMLQLLATLARRGADPHEAVGTFAGSDQVPLSILNRALMEARLDPEALRLMLWNSPADPPRAPGLLGLQTPGSLHFACMNPECSLEVVEALLECGADPNRWYLDGMQGLEGIQMTVLARAVCHGHEAVFERLSWGCQANPEVFQLEAPAALPRRSARPRDEDIPPPPLQPASEEPSREADSAEHPAGVDHPLAGCRIRCPLSLLHFVGPATPVSLVQRLLRSAALVDLVLPNVGTPTAVALSFDRLDIVQELLMAGCQVIQVQHITAPWMGDDRLLDELRAGPEIVRLFQATDPTVQARRRQEFLNRELFPALQRCAGLSTVVASLVLQANVPEFRIRVV